MNQIKMKLKRKHKKIIFALGFWSLASILFLICSIFLIFWAAGINYNFKTHRFQKTGLIYLNSDPRDVKVYLDGRLKRVGTPTKLSVFAERYEITIRKNSYHPWTKDISVTAGKVFRYDNIALFKLNPETTKFDKNVKIFSLAPNKEMGLYLSDKLKTFRINENQKSEVINNYSFQNPKILWSDNSQKALLTENKKYYLYNSATNKVSGLIFNLSNITKIKWLSNNSENFMVLNDNNLYQINITGEKTLISQNIIDFSLSGNILYSIVQEKNKFILKRMNLRWQNQTELVSLNSENYKIITRNSEIYLIDKNNNLYFIKDGGLKKINSKILGFDWFETSSLFGLVKKTQLLYCTNLDEIWIWDPETQKNILVTRFEKDLQKISWYSDLNHILYSTADEIRIIEADGKNDTFLAKGKNYSLVNFQKILVIDLENNLVLIKIR